MNSLNKVNVKNHTYCFFHDMFNVKNLDQDKIKIDEKLCKNIFIYHIECVTIKDLSYAKINCVNSLYLNINKMKG